MVENHHSGGLTWAYIPRRESLWGAIPIYFKTVSQVPALEVLAHRVVWTVVFLGLIILFTPYGIQGWNKQLNIKSLTF